MQCVNPVAVDAMLNLLFKQFQEHRWQTKLAAVQTFAALAKSSTKAVTYNLPEIVRQLMEVSQDPKPIIKETAMVALKSCCSVIDNPDVVPLIDMVISANINPDTEGEPCLDRLVGTTYVNNVDKPTLSIIVPILLRGLRVKGNVNMNRKAAIVMDTMCKLVKDPEDIAPFSAEVIPDLQRNAEEIAIPEIRERTAEALNTVKVAVGEYTANAMKCDAIEVEAVLAEITNGNAYYSDEVTQWVSLVTTPLFTAGRPRPMESVVPYLKATMSEAEAIVLGEKFLEEGAKKFGAGVEEEVVEDHDDLAVLCDCEFSLAYGNRVLLHNTKLKLKRGKCYGLIGPNGAGKSTLMRSIAAGVVEGFPKEIKSVYVECDVSAADADYICWEFIHQDPLIQSMGKTKDQVIDMMRSCTFSDTLIFGPVGSLSGGWRMRLALSRAMLKEPELLLLDEPTNHVDVHGVAWLTKYIQELSGKEISSMVVSHDSVFLDNVAQDICHYEKNRKLKVYKGNLSDFVKVVPEAASYYKLETDAFSFNFPAPGMLEGVTSRTKALIKMSDVSFKYPTRDVNTLYNISVQVSMASRVAVIGVNGAGKSTTFSMLTGAVAPTSGDATLFGLSILRDQRALRRLVGYCPQHDALEGLLTGRETLRMYARIKQVAAEKIEAEVEGLLQDLDLAKFADKPAGTYSGGNKRKLCVGIALVGAPSLVLLDEPSSGMDAASKRFLWTVIKRRTAQCCTVLTTHSMEECEALCGRLGVMVDGSLRCVGPIQSLKSRYGQGYKLELRMDAAAVEAAAAAPSATQELSITLPEHAVGGSMLTVQTPAGMMQVPLPPDVGPGMPFSFVAPAAGGAAARIVDFVQQRCPEAKLEELEPPSITFTVPTAASSLSQLFGHLAEAQKELQVGELSVTQCTLEQVFILMASKQQLRNQGSTSAAAPPAM